MEAFQLDRHLSIQRKLQAQDPSNKEYMKQLSNDLEKHKEASLTKILLSNINNSHPFSSA